MFQSDFQLKNLWLEKSSMDSPKKFVKIVRSGWKTPLNSRRKMCCVLSEIGESHVQCAFPCESQLTCWEPIQHAQARTTIAPQKGSKILIVDGDGIFGEAHDSLINHFQLGHEDLNDYHVWPKSSNCAVKKHTTKFVCKFVG